MPPKPLPRNPRQTSQMSSDASSYSLSSGAPSFILGPNNSEIVIGQVKVGPDGIVPIQATPRGGVNTGEPPAAEGECTVPAATVDIDDLCVVRELGRGAQGVVSLYQHPSTGSLYAVKKVPLQPFHNRSTIGIGSEIRNIFHCNYPEAIALYNAYVREGDVFLVLEYLDGGDLEHLLRANGKDSESSTQSTQQQQYDALDLSLRSGSSPMASRSFNAPARRVQHRQIEPIIVAHIADQLLLALSHLHQKRRLFETDRRAKLLVHRDIKPANIMLSSTGAVKLADFGVAAEADSLGVASFKGTTCYMAPERIKSTIYGPPSDIWSVGVVAAQLLLGHFPYEFNIRQPLGLLRQYETPIVLPPDVATPEVTDFIHRCLNLEPTERATAAELLSHPWLVQSRAAGGGRQQLADLVVSVQNQLLQR